VPPIKTQARSATILPNFVGLKFQIHNGKSYLDITITEDMVGHKLGEFAPYVSRNGPTEDALADDSTTGHENSSCTSRPRTNEERVARASYGSLGIILVGLEAILYCYCTIAIRPLLGKIFRSKPPAPAMPIQRLECLL
jgi:hypothetical protein